MRTYQLAGGILALLLAGASASAQSTDPPAGTTQAAPSDPAVEPQAAAEGTDAREADQAADDKNWKFYTLGYVWLATAKGKTDVIGPLQPVDLEAIRRYCRDRLGGRSPLVVIRFTQLPRNAIGKVVRQELTRMALAELERIGQATG